METKSEVKGNPYPGSLVVSEDANGTMYAVYAVASGSSGFVDKLYFTVWNGTEWQNPRELFTNFNDSPQDVYFTPGDVDLVFSEKDGLLHLLFEAGPKNISKLYHSIYKTPSN